MNDLPPALKNKLHGIHQNGKGWTALCPAHDDQRNSLTIGEGADGRVLLHCHAGCSVEQVVAALGLTLADLMPAKKIHPAPKRRILCTYDYRDENGILLSQAVRFEPKEFKQRRPDGKGGWIWNMEGVRRVPYRLPELLAAPDEEVYIVEGEKDVDNLRKWGLVATCNAMGAGSWTDEHAKHLIGRKAILLPDNDAPGHKHAETVARTLAGIATEIRWLELPDLAEHGDVSDWIAAGGTLSSLLALVEAAPLSDKVALSDTNPPDEEDPEIDPLMVEPGQWLPLGWIDDYASIASALTASPVEFHRLGALMLGALAIRRSAFLAMAFGNVYCNLFGAIIAPSSVYHKTAALRKVTDMMAMASLHDMQLANLMTPEGLLAEMENKPQGLILRDEIGTLFASHNVRYLSELKPLLTELYDCQTSRRRLSSKEITVTNPYLNILGATTPVAYYEAIALRDWRDGFMARWLFVLPDGPPDFDADALMMETSHRDELTRLARKLRDLREMQPKAWLFADGVLKEWDQWRKDGLRRAYEYGDETVSQVMSRAATNALKFAMILTALNGEWGLIELDAMQRAMHLSDWFKGQTQRLRAQTRVLVSPWAIVQVSQLSQMVCDSCDSFFSLSYLWTNQPFAKKVSHCHNCHNCHTICVELFGHATRRAPVGLGRKYALPHIV